MHIASPPLSAKQIGTKLTDAIKEQLGPDCINQENLGRIVNYLGVIIKNGGIKSENHFIACAPETAIFAARKALEAKIKENPESSELLQTTLSTLEKAFSGEMGKAKAFQASLEVASPVLDVIISTLGNVKNFGTEGKISIQSLVAEAEASSQGDVTLFGQHLKELLEARSGDITKAQADSAVDSIKTLKAESQAYSSFEATPSLTGITKFIKVEEGISTQKLGYEDKQVVINLITGIKTELSKETNEKKGLAILEAKLVNGLAKLSPEQKLYFKELCSKYEELNKIDPSKWLEKISESLPGLVIPGILGVIFASLCGFSVSVGAMGAAALSFLGSTTTAAPSRKAPPAPAQAA